MDHPEKIQSINFFMNLIPKFSEKQIEGEAPMEPSASLSV